MRKLKFRAWDNKNKEMHLNPVVTNYSWYKDHKHYESDISFEDTPKGQVIMQYTGICDKNGKPIYEGDIVKTKSGWMTEIVYTGYKFNGVYRNADGSWDDELEDDILRDKNIEVVGNVYENNNLLDELDEDWE